MSPGRKPSRSPASTAGRDSTMRSTAPRSDLGEPVGRRAVVAGMAQQAIDVTGPDVLALAHPRIELLQHLARRLARRRRPGQGDDVAVGLRLDAEPLLEQRQMSVILAEQPVQMPIVLEGHDHARLRSSQLLAQTCGCRPSNASQLDGLLAIPSIPRICTPHPSTISGLRHQCARALGPGTTSPARLFSPADTIVTSTSRPRSEESAFA